MSQFVGGAYLSFNNARPLVMHIDLNSCFATVEQQARPTLRGRPVGIANRRTAQTSLVTVSYEAKARGVRMGMRVDEARRLCPDLVVLESDPPKYRYVYRRLMAIMSDYSPSFTMKSIDEGVIDFADSPASVRDRDLEEVAREIKHRLRTEIGCWMRCNIGIGTSRWLAKTAASLHKPDGLDVITHQNLREVLANLELIDLTGIAEGNRRRLNAVGIFTPLQFVDASQETLERVVFRSICGRQWYQRLRGWEVDDVEHDVHTVGRQYVLEAHTLDRQQIARRLHHLAESVGYRMRSQGRAARGIRIYARTADGYWRDHHLAPLPFYSDEAIWRVVARLFAGAPSAEYIREIGVSCYHLHTGNSDQLSLFGDELAREMAVVGAVDEINARWGERTIHSADTLGTGIYVKQKIPFGGTRYL